MWDWQLNTSRATLSLPLLPPNAAYFTENESFSDTTTSYVSYGESRTSHSFEYHVLYHTSSPGHLEILCEISKTSAREGEVAQSCLTLCDPMDCSLPGSSVHGIFQARVPEWIAISFSKGCSQPRDRTQVSCIVDRHFTVWATRQGDIVKIRRTSLVVQWLRICLPMQGTRVRSLVEEDPTRLRATRPEHHNYWSQCSGAHVLQQEKPVHRNQRVAPAHHNWRKPACSNADPVQPKVNKCIFKRLRNYPFLLPMCVVPQRHLRVNQFSYLFFSFQSVQTVLYYKFGMCGIIIWRIDCLEKHSHKFNDFP